MSGLTHTGFAFRPDFHKVYVCCHDPTFQALPVHDETRRLGFHQPIHCHYPNVR